MLPRPLTVGPGAGRRQARVGGCGPPSSNPGRSPYSEPIEAQQLCLQGLSPARTLEKHFRGSGGGKSFGTGTARGLELPGPPRRGGAGWGGASPAELRKAAPRLVTNPFCPEAPRISQRRLRLLLLFQLFHSSHLILQTTKPRIGEFWCRAYTAYTAGLPTLQYSLHSRPPPLKIVIVNIY